MAPRLATAASMPLQLLLILSALLLAARGEMWLGTPPMGWEDFDSHVSASYNESFARKSAAVQAQQLLPSGYDTWHHWANQNLGAENGFRGF